MQLMSWAAYIRPVVILISSLRYHMGFLSVDTIYMLLIINRHSTSLERLQ